MKRLSPDIEFLTAAIVFCVIFVSTSCSRQPVYSPPLVSGDHAVIDTEALKPDVPHFFTYSFKDGRISFFVVKLDHLIASYLDACATCYMHKQGYRYEDGAVTCRYCNMKFSIYKLEKGLGGCYPIKIRGRVENGNYLIPVKTMEAAAGKF